MVLWMDNGDTMNTTAWGRELQNNSLVQGWFYRFNLPNAPTFSPTPPQQKEKKEEEIKKIQERGDFEFWGK